MRALSHLKTMLSPELLQAAFSRLHGLGHIVRSPFGRSTRVAAPTVTLDGDCHAGRVYLVGAGSGDVELLTLKAARLLQQADAVVYDRLVGDDVLALIPAGHERYYVGKERGHHSVPQAEIGALLVKLAGQGKSVVRLKGGDPGVFGRMGEELAALAEAGVAAEIVPGITAASAAAAGMGIPLTDRAHAQQLRFITAQLCRKDGEPDWATLARQDETLIFYMGLTKVEAICAGLRRHGLPDDWPIMLVANASLPEQASLVGTLADMPGKLAASPLPSPCLIVVGSVVSMVATSPAAAPSAQTEASPSR
ncbi:uroporphyrinogen-III C-methyltransferase [Billgrantia bachuensis]|uniref:uroporphyrinogen-III C-methyltransferase n=1 Tax=Billgrantia bachuensis TaxID=2717286 RepID=A0ABX0PVR3_9GAMM|nr:uroporphyrinogen-III C-methyltransferase [Halomonas bachuensis]NIC06147.1 uroporphyrinogen-III C-methyltransferase [Halomonas bachuensis]